MASNSLGTLTLDLIAKVGGFAAGLDKAERDSLKWRKEVEKNAKAVGVAIGAGVAFGTTALAALTVSTVKSAAEISRFAAVSGESTEAFQRYAAGAKAVGVEQDKLADIFKDTSDKVGDFLQTGGGALADFFENIAPKVGVTADAFRKLSGPQALELYVSSLEKAGASQNEMTFYMEAIASDATLLLPLLRNNAEGFRELGDAAVAAGAIMDDSTIRAANELAAATMLADQALDGIKNQIMQAMLPVLSDLASEFFEVATSTTVAEDAGEAFAAGLKIAAATATGAFAAFQLLGKSIAAIGAAMSAADLEASDFLLGPIGVASKIGKNFEQVRSTLEIGLDDVRQTALEYGEVIDGIWDAGSDSGNKANDRVKKYADLLEQARKASSSTGVVIEKAEGKKAKAAKTAADAVEQQLSAIERAAAVWGMSADEVQIYDLRLKGATESQIEYAQSLLNTVSGLEKQKKAQEAIATLEQSLSASRGAESRQYDDELAGIGLSDKAQERLRSQRALIADYQDQVNQAAQMRASGDIDDQGYEKQLELYKDNLDQRLAMQQRYYSALDSMESDWQAGASKGLQNYADQARDIYGQTAELIQGTMESLSSGVAESLTGAIMHGEDLRASMEALSQTILEQVLGSLIEMGVQYGVNAALEIAGITAVSGAKVAAAGVETTAELAKTTAVSGAEVAAAGVVAGAEIAAIGATTTASLTATAATTATQTAAAAATTAAWTPAAIVSSIGSFGTAAAIGLAAVVAALAFGKGFRSGGYTGNGGVDDVAGVVHGKEFVFDAESTSRIGVANLEAIRAGRMNSTLERVSVDMVEASGTGRTGSGRSITVNQTNNYKGVGDNRTASQANAALASKMRATTARLGG